MVGLHSTFDSLSDGLGDEPTKIHGRNLVRGCESCVEKITKQSPQRTWYGLAIRIP